jgi:hypothetical protein
MIISLTDVTDVPSEANSQAEGIPGFQVTGPYPLKHVFIRGLLYTGSVRGK